MLMLGWTTVETRAEAKQLAEECVRLGLAACVQIDGPIESVFIWDKKPQSAAEYRLLIKFIPARGDELAAWLLQNHPYDVPEWVVVRAEHVAEKYLSWACSNCTSAPF